MLPLRLPSTLKMCDRRALLIAGLAMAIAIILCGIVASTPPLKVCLDTAASLQEHITTTLLSKPPLGPTTAEKRLSWLRQYYGKTLASLGDIIAVGDKYSRYVPSDHDAEGIWKIINTARIYDHSYISTSYNLPPIFSLEYANGVRVYAEAEHATITLPDGRSG